MDLGAVYIGDRPGCCHATGMADPPSAATCNVMRTDTLRRYGALAGFRTPEVLPIANDVLRFYRPLLAAATVGGTGGPGPRGGAPRGNAGRYLMAPTVKPAMKRSTKKL